LLASIGFVRVGDALAIVKPETVVKWHRAGFRLYWRWKSNARGGRPTVPLEIGKLIREISIANPLTFLRNHADGIAAINMFVVPTISFRLLYGLLIMRHGRRHILWFGVTAHPTAEWIANQITQACGWEQAPRYLIHDRDGAYGEVLIRRLRSIGIRDRPTSPRSPWQNAYAERLIGSIRRECLDHVIVFSKRHLRNPLLCYMKYYNGTRTHLSLDKDAPISRAVELAGHILYRSILGGLHHQHVRI
jgi:Integrase core domain